MDDKLNINKACRYYLLKDKDVLVNFILFALVSLGFIYLIDKGVFESRGSAYLLLMLYVLILGMTILISNTMIVNLTVKDQLNKRIEFIAASGINIEEMIKSYAIEIWRLSSILPFLFYFLSYVIGDYDVDFKWIILIFVSTLIMSYFEILYLNILSLYQKNFKFFKNMIFFGTAILIYMVGTFSKDLLSLLDKYHLNITYIILGVNIGLTLIFAFFSLRDLGLMTNESVIQQEGSWS